MADLEEFNYECLYAHNGLRATHGVNPLRYNKNLAKEAQEYAEIIAERGELEHSKKEDRNNAGENLASSKKPFAEYAYSGLGATVAWYSEIKDYDFNLEEQRSREPTGHFTQVIWKESQEAGFGRAKNTRSNEWFIVGRYQPAGNFVGKYKQNVPPLPQNLKWDNVPVVEDHLEELRTMEYTKARKHILDDWMMSSVSGTKSGVPYVNITETFTTPKGEQYSETKNFDEDPTKKPRPTYEMKFDGGVYDTDYDDPFKFNDDDENLHSSHDKEEKNFIDSLVDYHNKYRTKHGAWELDLDHQLSMSAQDWAERLAREDKMSFSDLKFKNQPVGENLTVTKGKVNENAAKSLIESWYNESRVYSYGKEPNNFKNVGHFTQIIWRNSALIGVGVAESKKGNHYIVCFYHPPGNVQDQFREQVHKAA